MVKFERIARTQATMLADLSTPDSTASRYGDHPMVDMAAMSRIIAKIVSINDPLELSPSDVAPVAEKTPAKTRKQRSSLSAKMIKVGPRDSAEDLVLA